MTAQRLAAIFGFLAVSLGAFGAHGLKSLLEDPNLDWWNTAVLYHLVHAPVLLACGREGVCSAVSRAGWAFVAGIVVFSGSLYLMTLTDMRWLGAITPLGGLALLAGWVLLFLDGRKAT